MKSIAKQSNAKQSHAKQSEATQCKAMQSNQCKAKRSNAKQSDAKPCNAVTFTYSKPSGAIHYNASQSNTKFSKVTFSLHAAVLHWPKT